MRFHSIIVLLLITFSHFVKADDDKANKWAEFSLGINGNALSIKTINEDLSWSFEIAEYTSELFTKYQDRETGKIIDYGVTTLSVSKNLTGISSFGYVDAGIGLGIGMGTWVSDCGEPDVNFLTSTQVCDLYEGASIGVPVRASIVLGKFLGIGITVSGFISLDGVHSNLMFTIPFGNFTR